METTASNARNQPLTVELMTQRLGPVVRRMYAQDERLGVIKRMFRPDTANAAVSSVNSWFVERKQISLCQVMDKGNWITVLQLGDELICKHPTTEDLENLLKLIRADIAAASLDELTQLLDCARRRQGNCYQGDWFELWDFSDEPDPHLLLSLGKATLRNPSLMQVRQLLAIFGK